MAPLTHVRAVACPRPLRLTPTHPIPHALILTFGRQTCQGCMSQPCAQAERQLIIHLMSGYLWSSALLLVLTPGRRTEVLKSKGGLADTDDRAFVRAYWRHVAAYAWRPLVRMEALAAAVRLLKDSNDFTSSLAVSRACHIAVTCPTVTCSSPPVVTDACSSLRYQPAVPRLCSCVCQVAGLCIVHACITPRGCTVNDMCFNGPC